MGRNSFQLEKKSHIDKMKLFSLLPLFTAGQMDFSNMNADQVGPMMQTFLPMFKQFYNKMDHVQSMNDFKKTITACSRSISNSAIKVEMDSLPRLTMMHVKLACKNLSWPKSVIWVLISQKELWTKQNQ